MTVAYQVQRLAGGRWGANSKAARLGGNLTEESQRHAHGVRKTVPVNGPRRLPRRDPSPLPCVTTPTKLAGQDH